MSKLYGVVLTVEHYVEVEADSVEEAEELAWDKFSDDAGFWDETIVDDLFVIEEEL